MCVRQREYYCCYLDTKSCPTLCDPMHCSLPGSSVQGTSQTRIRQIEPRSLESLALAGGFFTTNVTWEACVSISQP